MPPAGVDRKSPADAEACRLESTQRRSGLDEAIAFHLTTRCMDAAS